MAQKSPVLGAVQNKSKKMVPLPFKSFLYFLPSSWHYPSQETKRPSDAITDRHKISLPSSISKSGLHLAHGFVSSFCCGGESLYEERNRSTDIQKNLY